MEMKMKIKKSIMLLLSVCLALSSALIPFTAQAAEQETTVVTAASNAGMNIEATTVVVPTPGYTVSVPTGIAFGEIVKTEESAEKTADLSVGVSGFSEMEGKQIKVTVSTPDGTFNMYSGKNALPYRVYNSKTSNTPLEMNGVFHIFQTAETVEGCIKIDTKDITEAGSYGGTLTFTFEVENQ